MIRALATGVLALAAAGITPVAAAFAEELTQAEIRNELVGRRIVWWQSDGWQSGHLTLGEDGRAELSIEHPARLLDTGRWVVRDGALCTEWATMRAGAEKCYRIERGQGGRFLTDGGNVFEIRQAGV